MREPGADMDAEESRANPSCERSQFNTTHWSVVLTAQTRFSPAAQAALETLCCTYWYPLYAFVRRQGHSPHDAQDLTQALFEHLLRKDFLREIGPNKGRFRSFLLACLKHFLADEWDKVRAEKRSPGKPLISLDALDAETRYRLEPANLWDAERIYSRRWTLTLIGRVLDRLQQEFVTRGKMGVFARLEPYLLHEDGPSYAELAVEMGSTEAAIKKMVSRLRQRYRELFREEVAQTVTSPADIDEEIGYLLSRISG
ncbi:MAG: RNA polymerase sigma factor [Verrucomicrobiia bacterium]